MGKTFYGSFRITGITEIERGSDGNFYIRFADAEKNIIGAVFTPSSLSSVATQLNNSLSDIASGSTNRGNRNIQIVPGE